MNIKNLGTQLLFTTVPVFVELNNGNTSFGTGFILSYNTPEMKDVSIPLLITNYHVVENVKIGYLEFNVQENGEPILSKSVKVKFDINSIKSNRLDDLDLVAIPIGHALTDLMNKGINVFYKSVSLDMIPNEQVISKFSAIEELSFIGYPSGLYDTKNHLSIVRRGITASPLWSNYKGQPKFLIDGGVFPGSSGSPVFIYNQGSFATDEGITVGTRLYFVGIVCETNVIGEKAYINLGIAINSWTMKLKLDSLLKPVVDQLLNQKKDR